MSSAEEDLVSETRLQRAERLLRHCEEQFTRYAEQHRAKISENLSPRKVEETLAKAVANEMFASLIRKFLDEGKNPPPLTAELTEVAP